MAGDDVAVGACPFGGITMFSSHPVKTIATGEGGMLTTNDGELAALLKRLRNHGMTPRRGRSTRPELAFDPVSGAVNPWYYEMAAPGLNYRLSDLHAALGLSQLGKLPGFIAQRRALHAHYHAGLGALGLHIRPAGLAPKGVAAWHLAVALIDFDALGVTGRRSSMGCAPVASVVRCITCRCPGPYYRDRYGAGDYRRGGLLRRILSLPLYPAMTIGDVDRVLDALDTVAHGRRQVTASLPPWQGHQDSLDIAAGLETEQSSPVVQQVEFHVAAAFDQLGLSLFLGPRAVHVPANQLGQHPERRGRRLG